MLSQYANWFGKLLKSRVVLEHPEAPEDTRVVNLFRNRAELKKSLSDAQDEIHRLKDRVKLQEAATARVREQLEALEGRLATPLTGLDALLHYQLRDLWTTAHAQLATLVRELAEQREERERRQFLADLNRQTFERHQSAKQSYADAERTCADLRSRLAVTNQALLGARSWWKYFARRELQRRRHALVAESRAADELQQQARSELQQVEQESGAKYPGLSLEARRTLNLTAIAGAWLLAVRLAPPALLTRVQDAMSRSEPKGERSDAASSVAAMQEIARARAAMLQSRPALPNDVRRVVDRLAREASYRSSAETVPAESAVRTALVAEAARADTPATDLLASDLWSVSDLFYE